MIKGMKINVLKVDYHRNGVAGNGFHVVLFKHDKTLKVGIVFPEQGNVAVLDVGLLHEGTIESGENSWRGDDFEPALRVACDAFECGREQR